MSETKEINSASLNVSLHSADATQAPYIAKCITDLGRGDAQDDRDGNEVNITSVQLKGSLSVRTLAEDPDSVFPTHVRFLIVSQKRNQIVSGTVLGAFPTVAEINTLFQNGGASQGFQGNIMDMYRKVNKDTWTKHYDKIFKLGRNDGLYSNNDYKLQRDWTINLPKSLLGKTLYNDGLSTPTNKQYWLMATAVKFDGSTTGVAFQPVEISHQRQTRFVDF